MQLVKASRDALLKPLATVSGIVERRHTLPILANILLRKDGSRVSFVSTDIEVQITTHADFGVGDASESTTVAARKLLDILRALPDTGDVSLSLANKKLSVQSGKSRFALQTLAAEEFPTVAQPATWNASLTMTQKSFKHLLNMVHFAMAQQDIRYYLNGMLLVIDGFDVRCVSTDGHRLAYCSVTTETESPKQEVIIPRKTVLELLRLLDDSEEPVQIDVAANQIRFRFAEIELISKLVEGKFPDYQRVIPSGYTKHFLIAREALQRSLQRAAILTTDKFKGVRMQMADHVLKISASNAEQEEAQEELDIDFSFEPLDIGFNVSYLLDVLGNLKAETVQWGVGDANSSALITLPDNADFKYVVMPMRI
ncbi:DNA polymerase III subunit beta [Pigmentiphaga litoralis]|jgi:DNA polymerase-3 subunit beta|uniref:Beta sliding clamp n=1 Tax=Pigmentiphaga litoralis TaxID=516702 RepID=A0A7Y9IQA3_9BURK|nr:DNA polymerase III subunit beta [Pigmentiphaga litoralis]NYE25385.1 DNA polymerase-3 subunit beta [Pigmentiphaga litoralis]NYE81003.1 DNA polymerase-3 subunit beta [Pigmentiphaga litoralis]